MTSSYEEMVDSNSVLSSEIERTKNLYHSSLIEGDDERARHKLTIQVSGLSNCKDELRVDFDFGPDPLFLVFSLPYVFN